ncbi:MAG: inositol monophosphatase family protein [Pseudomonadota bacterium]
MNLLAETQREAEAVITEMGAIALKHFRRTNPHVRAAKGALDFTTEVDLELEAFCKDAIAKRFPDHAFFGEESGGAFRGPTWVVDPIDGTHNYAIGLPWWCISLALVSDGRPAIGLVFDPLHDELYSAAHGLGAFLNEQRLRPGTATSFHGKVVGFGLAAGRPAYATLSALRGLAARSASVRAQGAGALALCSVAAGRLDAFFEHEIHLWDVAGACAILGEAGCDVRFSFDTGSPSDARPIVAARPGLGAPLHQLLNDEATEQEHE